MEVSGKIRFAAATATALGLLSGCGGDGSTNNSGQLTLGLTDGPRESATSVVVAFTGIELKPAGGPPMQSEPFNEDSCDDFDAATRTCSINLLALTGESRKVVFSRDIEAGVYQWVRLLVAAEPDVMDTYLTDKDGRMCSLYIPSGDENGLKIVSGITVTANGRSDYTLDFDVRKSITSPQGLDMNSVEACAENYMLKPAIRIVDTTEVGTISGTVSEALLGDSVGCTRSETTGEFENVAAYVFENFDGAAIADDLDADPTYPDPVTTATVSFDGAVYAYEAAYLLSPEDYLVALTCTADADMMNDDEFNPASPDPQDFSFFAEQTVTTQVGGTVDASF